MSYCISYECMSEFWFARVIGFVSMFGIRGVGECECAGVRVGECGRGSGWEGEGMCRRVYCIGCGRVDGSTYLRVQLHAQPLP